MGNGVNTVYLNTKYVDLDQSRGKNFFWRLVNTDGKLDYELCHGDMIIFGDSDSACGLFPESVVKAYNDDPSISIEDGLVELADSIGDAINDSFPDFIKQAFNIPDERLQSISTAREIVSDKSLLLTKKRYIMHVVNDEGKKVDKMKMMGVQIVRSSTSKFLKDVLLELVDTILDTIDEDGVHALKRKYRDLIYDYDPRDLATPCGTKTLRKYQEIYDETGSMKGVFWSARASMFWNSQCGVMDERIYAGDRVGTLYIKHATAKHIAFPIDIVKFPHWFSKIVIDYDTIWKKTDKVIEDYLKSIDLNLSARKASVVNSIFTFDNV